MHTTEPLTDAEFTGLESWLRVHGAEVTQRARSRRPEDRDMPPLRRWAFERIPGYAPQDTARWSPPQLRRAHRAWVAAADDAMRVELDGMLVGRTGDRTRSPLVEAKAGALGAVGALVEAYLRDEQPLQWRLVDVAVDACRALADAAGHHPAHAQAKAARVSALLDEAERSGQPDPRLDAKRLARKDTWADAILDALEEHAEEARPRARAFVPVHRKPGGRVVHRAARHEDQRESPRMAAVYAIVEAATGFPEGTLRKVR